MSTFPQRRPRRLRRSEGRRQLVRETRLSPADFIAPVFVVEDPAAAGPVASMPGVSRHTLATLPRELEEISAAGVGAVLFFGVPAHKDAGGSAALTADSLVAHAVKCCKLVNTDLVVITDVCLCSYTSHGHCGIVEGGEVCNDATLPLLARMAAIHARAGADLVAPSGMMDGQVAAIRSALDEAGCTHTGVLSYAVKYASSFYGPFRDAADCTPEFGDRRAYQMDPANAAEALAEARLDVDEGADALMVKPALPYLDVVRRVKDAHPDVPLAAYQVSGEYSMLKAAAARGFLDERAAALETLIAIRRAGADMIVTYWAKDAARWALV